MKKYLTFKNLGWLFIIASIFLIGNTAINKIIGTEQMTKNFEFMNLSKFMLPIGILEMFCIIGLIVPVLSKYAAIVITALMGGAIAIHLSLMNGNMVKLPVTVLFLTWAGYWLRENVK